jgi:hypothetical protein
MHIDTYPESIDSPGEVPTTLKGLVVEHHLTEREIRVMQIGEQFVCIPQQQSDARLRTRSSGRNRTLANEGPVYRKVTISYDQSQLGV